MSLAIDGLASGLDTSNIISQLMEIERRPIRLLEVRRNEMQQRMDAWRDINSRLNRLDNLMADLVRSGTYEGRKVTSSNADVATATAANRAEPAVYTVEVEQLATAHRLAIDEAGLSNLVGDIQINGVRITVNEGMSVADLAAAIKNAEDDIGVRATVIAGTLVLESKTTGTEGAIKLLRLNGEESVDITDQYQMDGGEAKDAVFFINGVRVERSSNTISDAVEGITFHLRDTGTTVITVSQDVDEVISRIQAFVDQYNSAMEFMREKLAEGAILQGDATLMRLQMGLRQAVLDRVSTSGGLNQLAQIGITATREGRLEFDQAKFREAFQENPSAVKELFAGDGEHGGAIGRAREYLKNYIQAQTGIIAGRQEMLSGQVETIKDNIERMEARLERRAEMLYRQFAALEQALAQLQSQSNWLQMQLQQFVPAAR